jgi:uncharacterized protein YqkB
MTETIAIITLAIICVLQTIERYFYQKDMTNKLNDAIKAVMSRNISEYLSATAQPTSKEKVEIDQVDFNADNPEAFDQAIKKM